MPDTIYGVEFVEETELPTGLNWALVRKPRTATTPPRKWLFIKREHVCPAVMIDAWQALHRLDDSGAN